MNPLVEAAAYGMAVALGLVPVILIMQWVVNGVESRSSVCRPTGPVVTARREILTNDSMERRERRAG